ncbi:hypothetical protein AB8880_08535 [Alphaproteobacteria bacterium LSUCC0684]
MELSPIAHNNAGMRRNPRRDEHLEDEAPEHDDGPGDLYEALGYRKPVMPGITTQQWLEKRLLIENIFT